MTARTKLSSCRLTATTTLTRSITRWECASKVSAIVLADHPVLQYVDEKEDTGKPVIRLFGVNAAGNSVCAHVHNFTAYFYIHVVERDVTLTNEQLEEFRINLNK